MIDVERFREVVDKKKINYEDLAKSIGMNRSTLFRRLKHEGQDFTVGEIQKLKSVLNLSKKDAMTIFFK